MPNVATGQDLWIRRFHRAPAHDLHGPRLVCFPHAGASASSFFSFSRSLADALEVVVIQYPGRQDRRKEPSFRDIAELADQIFLVLKTLADRPLVFFGHSMGAIAAFEVALRLEAERGYDPIALFVSGRRAPSQYRKECMHKLDDAELVMKIRQLSGTDARILADEELLQMILPVIRSDYKAIETYRYQEGSKLRCPIHAFVGDADNQATIAEVAAWEKCATGNFTLSIFPGGHFYLNENQVEIAKAVVGHLTSES